MICYSILNKKYDGWLVGSLWKRKEFQYCVINIVDNIICSLSLPFQYKYIHFISDTAAVSDQLISHQHYIIQIFKNIESSQCLKHTTLNEKVKVKKNGSESCEISSI